MQAWYLVHKWTSLVCTAFLLMLCVTGLPLVFGEEIAHRWCGAGQPAARAAPVNLDILVDKAKTQYPAEQPLFLGWFDGQPIVYVNLGPTPDTPPAQMHTPLFPERT